MPETKDYPKNIFCLESPWGQDAENRLTVRPILDLIEKRHDVRCVHMMCNTVEEMKCNLAKFNNEIGHGILYLAFHGKPGRIVLNEESIDLGNLAQLFGSRFASCIVLFGSCGTIDVPREQIMNFMAVTKTTMIMGYRKKVDWMESAALDLLLFHRIQLYKDMRKFWSDFRNQHHDLISITGLEVFRR